MVNSPFPTNLAGECRKAAKILNSFIATGQGDKGPDSVIPPDILARAKGLAIFTVIKAGFLFSGRAGSGIVVARMEDGSGWSAPSCIATGGMGFGGQIGAEVTDFVVVLNSADAVKAFSHGGNVTLGGNLSVAAGPVGRNAEAAGTVGNLAAIFSYSKTKGLFVGVSIEGSVIVERKDSNAKFYGRQITAKELLSGAVEAPAAADPLYAALLNRASVCPVNGEPSKTNTISAAYGKTAPPPPPPLGKKPTIRPGSFASNTGSFSSTHAPPQPAAMPNPPMVATHTTLASPPLPPPPPPRTITHPQEDVAIAQYDFAGEQPGDLPFKIGDRIVILRKTNSQNDWWTGSCGGKEGTFPANYVQLQ